MLSLFLRYRRPCFLALCALLGLACGDLAATLTGIRLARKNPPQLASQPIGRPVPIADPAVDLSFILQHHLFDQDSRTNVAPLFSLRPDDGAGNPVRSNFELVGMIVAGDRSLAVLRAGQETRTYGLGEEMPGGGRIEEIVRHRVIIRNADLSLTTLAMQEKVSPISSGVEQRAAVPGDGGGVRPAGDNRWVIPREMAASVRDNLGEQLRMALMQPRIVDGRTDGFIVKKITPGTLISQMGFRRGDVLKRVNNMTIDSPEKALQILQQLREARQLNVDLERDGKPLSFAYAIE